MDFATIHSRHHSSLRLRASELSCGSSQDWSVILELSVISWRRICFLPLDGFLCKKMLGAWGVSGTCCMEGQKGGQKTTKRKWVLLFVEVCMDALGPWGVKKNKKMVCVCVCFWEDIPLVWWFKRETNRNGFVGGVTKRTTDISTPQPLLFGHWDVGHRILAVVAGYWRRGEI